MTRPRLSTLKPSSVSFGSSIRQTFVLIKIKDVARSGISEVRSSRPSKAETRYSAFVTKNLLPPVVSGLHLISTPRSSDRFRQLHPPSSISENLGSTLGIILAFGQR